MVTNHLTSSLGDSHHAGHLGQLTELDDVILTVFEEVEDTFSFPVQSQKDARAFVRAVHGRGITYETLSEEIGEHLQILTSWRKSLGRQGIGEKVMKRINKPMNDLLEEPDYVWADKNPTPKQTTEQNGNHVEAKCEVNATNGNASEDNVKETVIPDAAIEEIRTQEPKTMESFINNLTETIINEVTGRTSPPTSEVEKTSSAVSSTKKISPPVSRRSSNSSEEEQEKEAEMQLELKPIIAECDEVPEPVKKVDEQRESTQHKMMNDNKTEHAKSTSTSIGDKIEKLKAHQRPNSPPSENNDTTHKFLKEPLKKLNSEPIRQRDTEQQNKDHTFLNRNSGGSVSDIINALNRNQKPGTFSKQTSSGSNSSGSSRTDSPINVNTNLSPSRSPTQHGSPVRMNGSASGTRHLIEEFEHKHDEFVHGAHTESPEHNEQKHDHISQTKVHDNAHTTKASHHHVDLMNQSTAAVAEDYSSDLDEDNGNQSPVLAELIKRVHAVQKTTRQNQKNQLVYLYILTDVPESKDYGRVKLSTSRYPQKRLKQAQMFNPDIRMYKAVPVSDAMAAFDEAKVSLLECKELCNTQQSNGIDAESELPGNWFTGQSLMDVNIILEEVEEKYAIKSHGGRLKSQTVEEESEC